MLYSHLSVDHVLKLAIEEKQIPVIIAGGPKTGKTTVLSKRICHLIKHHKVPPSQITVCTLTNSDAQKIKDAIKQFAGDEILKELNIGTFHSLCCHILRRHAALIGLQSDFQILKQKDAKEIIQSIISASQNQDPVITPDEAFTMISNAKLQFQTPSVYLKETVVVESDQQVRKKKIKLYEIYTEYEKAKNQNNSVDFDDLLFKTYELFQSHPDVCEQYKIASQGMFIDEIHHINLLQFEIAKKLLGTCRNITVAGDPSISTYFLQKFKQTFPDAKWFDVSPGKSLSIDTHNVLSACLLAPFKEGVLSWKWTDNASQNHDKLYTKLFRYSLVGYESSEDTVPVECIPTKDVKKRGEFFIDVYSKKDDRDGKKVRVTTLIAKNPQERDDWFDAIKHAASAEIEMPQIFMDIKTETAGSRKIPFPNLDNFQYKEKLNNIFNFVQEMVDETESKAEKALTDYLLQKEPGTTLNAISERVRGARALQRRVIDPSSKEIFEQLLPRSYIEQLTALWSEMEKRKEAEKKNQQPIEAEVAKLVRSKVMSALEKELAIQMLEEEQQRKEMELQEQKQAEAQNKENEQLGDFGFSGSQLSESRRLEDKRDFVAAVEQSLKTSNAASNADIKQLLDSYKMLEEKLSVIQKRQESLNKTAPIMRQRSPLSMQKMNISLDFPPQNPRKPEKPSPAESPKATLTPNLVLNKNINSPGNKSDSEDETPKQNFSIPSDDSEDDFSESTISHSLKKSTPGAEIKSSLISKSPPSTTSPTKKSESQIKTIEDEQISRINTSASKSEIKFEMDPEIHNEMDRMLEEPPESIKDESEEESEDVPSNVPTLSVKLSDITPKIGKHRLKARKGDDLQKRLFKDGTPSPDKRRPNFESPLAILKMNMTPTKTMHVRKMLQTGHTFWKYPSSKTGKKKLRNIFLSADSRLICWVPPGKKKSNFVPTSKNSIKVASVRKIERGIAVKQRRKQDVKHSLTGTLLGFKKDMEKVNADCLFSFVTFNKCLDLEGSTQKEVQLWADAWEHFIKTTSPLASE